VRQATELEGNNIEDTEKSSSTNLHFHTVEKTAAAHGGYSIPGIA